MRLRDLFGTDATIDSQGAAIEVRGLAVDSRAVKPGDLFFALAGHKTDGSRFIDAAVAAGAVAIASEHRCLVRASSVARAGYYHRRQLLR